MDQLFNEDGLILSEHYAEMMNGVVLPWLERRKTDETVAGYDGKPLFTSRFIPDGEFRGTVFIVHGFTENTVKYSELIYSLLHNNFSVLAYDQRGHGRSWRDEKVRDDSLVHIKRFDEYEKDLDCVCKAMEGKLPKPWKVLCHSMGGAVTGLFLMDHPGVFERAAMCSPMIAVNRRGKPLFLCKSLAFGFKLIGKGRERMFLSKPYSGRETFEGACATGKERFEWYSLVKDTNPKFHNNGPSYSWMLESLNVTGKLLSPRAQAKIDCPVKVYSAEDDWEVISEAQEQFVQGLKSGYFQPVPDTRHEIFRSTDETLFPWWKDVLSFFKGDQD